MFQSPPAVCVTFIFSAVFKPELNNSPPNAPVHFVPHCIVKLLNTFVMNMRVSCEVAKV